MQSNEEIHGIGMTSLRTRQRLVARLTEKGIKDVRVLEAMRDTPRHLFLDEALSSRAYEDLALPIGHQQTISQPYIVARMTEALIHDQKLESTPIIKALEVGTGCGYQAAILSRFSSFVSLTTGKYKIFNTACMAKIDFETNQWEEVSDNQGYLDWLISPNELN